MLMLTGKWKKDGRAELDERKGKEDDGWEILDKRSDEVRVVAEGDKRR